MYNQARKHRKTPKLSSQDASRQEALRTLGITELTKSEKPLKKGAKISLRENIMKNLSKKDGKDVENQNKYYRCTNIHNGITILQAHRQINQC